MNMLNSPAWTLNQGIDTTGCSVNLLMCVKRTAILPMAVLLFVALTLFQAVLAQVALAQVEIVESYPTIRNTRQDPDRPVDNSQPIRDNSRTGPRTSTGDVRPITEIGEADTEDGDLISQLYDQLQRVQVELAQQRGKVEELTNEIKKLKQQRLDDYVDLDNRIAELSGGSGRSQSRRDNASGSASLSTSGDTAATGNFALASEGEVDSYKNALRLLLESKNYDGAITAFNQHLQQFPGGEYEGNVLFWLGQIYVIQEKFPDAEKSFNDLIETYPNHLKAWEAKFALGKIYFQQGNRSNARVLLQEVADSNSDVARLASNYIQDNFQ